MVQSLGLDAIGFFLGFCNNGCFNEASKSLLAAIWETVDDNIRPIFEKMRDTEISLATWEMKSLDAGPGKVMSAVLNLGKFNWTSCTDKNCGVFPNHQKQLKKVGEVVKGHDAKNPPWSLLSPSDYGPLFSLSPLTSEDEELSPGQNTGKRCKGDDNDDEGEGEGDKAYQDRHDVTAQNLVQQAWAQATRVDGTVIVLHSGNHELVCVRHRDSQTLYVSDVIEPHKCEPGYGKIHVGIYVAAIQDAMDRMQQQPPPVSQLSLPGDNGADQDNNQGSGSGHKGGHGHHRGKPKGRRSVKKSRGLKSLTGGKDPTDDKLAIEKVIHEGSNCDIILMYLQYDVYDSPIPASFVRSAPPIMTHARCPAPLPFPQTIHSYSPEECPSIVLTSEIGRGATGVVHRGTLMAKIWDDAIPMDVVVKLAFDVEQRKALRSEYEIYRCLRLKGVHQGITTVLGLFNDSEDDACGLVMLYAGVPLSDLQDNLSISDYKSALSTLNSIHRAGILHRDICPENILISDLGITIVDFGHSELCDDKRAKRKNFHCFVISLGDNLSKVIKTKV